jgi:hypothetical protein
METAAIAAIILLGFGFGLCFTALGFSIALGAWRDYKRL